METGQNFLNNIYTRSAYSYLNINQFILQDAIFALIFDCCASELSRTLGKEKNENAHAQNKNESLARQYGAGHNPYYYLIPAGAASRTVSA